MGLFMHVRRITRGLISRATAVLNPRSVSGVVALLAALAASAAADPVIPPAPVTGAGGTYSSPLMGAPGQIVRFIRVNGYGVVRAKPGEAHIVFLVSTTDASAVTALQDNEKQVAKVVAELEKRGVPAGNVVWSESSLVTAPLTPDLPPTSIDTGSDNGSTPASQYTANARVEAKTYKVSDAAGIVQIGMYAGATSVLGMSFLPSEIDKLKQQALVVALKDAANKAGVLALGISRKDQPPIQLPFVISVTELPATAPESPGGAVAPPAEIAVPVNIEVVYAIG